MEEIDAAEMALLDGGQASVLSNDLNENDILGDSRDEKEIKREDEDLYDDAIAPSNHHDIKPVMHETKVSTPLSTQTSSTNIGSASDRKYCCYVGNMTWWTTDADLSLHIANLHVNDLLEMKFFENRTNGQSKGFAVCIFGSEQSVRIVTEKLPHKLIHGNSLSVLAYTKQSLAKLEDAAAKTQTRPDAKNPKKVGAPKNPTTHLQDDGCVNMGTIRIGAGGPSQMMRAGGGPPMHNMMMGPGIQSNHSQINRGPQPLMMNGQPPIQNQIVGRPIGGPGVGGPVQMNMPPSGARPLMPPSGGQPMMAGAPMGQIMQGPPGVGMPMQQRPPGMVYQQTGPQPLMQQTIRPPGVGQMPPPGAHVNPQVYPGMQGGPISDGEFEEIMNRNRTVSYSAISRAHEDASAGDYGAAIETLHTAIDLIKQSRVAHDDRCRALIIQLQETLSDIDKKSLSSRGGRKHRDRDRDRSRSRSRDRDRKRRRRSRSRSRSPRGRSHRY